MQYEGPRCHGLGAMNFQSQVWMNKKVEIFFQLFFFQSCLESSETHFCILFSHFENFHSDPPGRPPRESKISKKDFFFKILTHVITQSKFEVIWSDALRTVSLKYILVLTSKSW